MEKEFVMDIRRISLLLMGVAVGIIVFGVLVKLGFNDTYTEQQAWTPIISGAILLICSRALYKRTK